MVGRRFLLALLLVLTFAVPGGAAPLRVAVAGVEPFVISRDGIWTGLSVDIWQKVAALNEWEYEFHAYPDEPSAVQAVARGEADVVVAEIPISSDSLEFVEFSQPYFRSARSSSARRRRCWARAQDSRPGCSPGGWCRRRRNPNP